MLRSSLCNYSRAYIVFREIMAVPNTGTVPNNRDK